MHDAGAGSLYDAKAPIGQIAASVAPLPGEPVVVKNYPNSFEKTDLDALLKKSGARNLTLVGFMTHMCVNSTTRMAFNLGYRNTVVAGATANAAGTHGDRRRVCSAECEPGGLIGFVRRGRAERCGCALTG